MGDVLEKKSMRKHKSNAGECYFFTLAPAVLLAV
jgi:hypothetical protein